MGVDSMCINQNFNSLKKMLKRDMYFFIYNTYMYNEKFKTVF